MVPVVLFRLQAERVDAHLLLEGAHRDDAQRLGLPAREERRAMRPRRHANFDRDVADLVLGAPVGPLLLNGDALADDGLLELVERHLGRRAALLGGHERLLGGTLGGRGGVLGEHRLLDRLGGLLALELVLDLGGLVEGLAVGGANRVEHAGVDGDRGELFLRLPRFAREVPLEGAELLDLGVGDVERVEDLGLGDLVRAGLHHQDRLLGAGHDQVELRGVLRILEEVRLGGIHDEVSIHLADPHGAHGGGERDVGEHQRRRRTVHREDVIGMNVVDRQRDRHQLGVIAPFLREQRPDRPVDHPRGQRPLLTGATLALEERAGDFPGRVHPLLDVHRQREEIDVAEAPCDGGCEDHRVPLANDHRARGLLGHPAGLKRDLAAGDLHGDPRHVTTHMHCLPVPPVGRRSDSFFSFSERGELSGADGLLRTSHHPARGDRPPRPLAGQLDARTAVAQPGRDGPRAAPQGATPTLGTPPLSARGRRSSAPRGAARRSGARPGSRPGGSSEPPRPRR